MLKPRLIHPKINEVLGRAAHHSKVLIADGNYPSSSTLGPRAELVSLNLSPGVVNCTQVLEAVLSAIPVERANTMMYEKTGPYALSQDPPAWAQYPRGPETDGPGVGEAAAEDGGVFEGREYDDPSPPGPSSLPRD